MSTLKFILHLLSSLLVCAFPPPHPHPHPPAPKEEMFRCSKYTFCTLLLSIVDLWIIASLYFYFLSVFSMIPTINISKVTGTFLLT